MSVIGVVVPRVALTLAITGCGFTSPAPLPERPPGVPTFATQVAADAWLIRGRLLDIDVVDAAGGPIDGALRAATTTATASDRVRGRRRSP